MLNTIGWATALAHGNFGNPGQFDESSILWAGYVITYG
jgi:hypothetical protein